MSKAAKGHVAVIGGGLMGCGIAFVFAYGGYSVSVCEPNPDRRAVVFEKIGAICELLGVTNDSLADVEVVEDIKSAVGNAVFVVEAATENLAIKQSIFQDMEKWSSSDTILATNTSAIPISKIADAVEYKGRVIGAHFWNPPHLIELVEVVLGEQSDPAAAQAAMGLLSAVGMTPVLVKKDVPGFIGNRLQHALKREAIALVANGVCDARTLDTVVKLGFGARLPVMGPLEQSDLLGLELTVAIHETLMPDLDVTAEVHPFLRHKIEMGELGAKAGQGFRNWTQDEADTARNGLNDFLVTAAKARYAQRNRD